MECEVWVATTLGGGKPEKPAPPRFLSQREAILSERLSDASPGWLEAPGGGGEVGASRGGQRGHTADGLPRVGRRKGPSSQTKSPSESLEVRDESRLSVAQMLRRASGDRHRRLHGRAPRAEGGRSSPSTQEGEPEGRREAITLAPQEGGTRVLVRRGCGKGQEASSPGWRSGSRPRPRNGGRRRNGGTLRSALLGATGSQAKTRVPPSREAHDPQGPPRGNLLSQPALGRQKKRRARGIVTCKEFEVYG